METLTPLDKELIKILAPLDVEMEGIPDRVIDQVMLEKPTMANSLRAKAEKWFLASGALAESSVLSIIIGLFVFDGRPFVENHALDSVSKGIVVGSAYMAMELAGKVWADKINRMGQKN